MSRYGKTVAAPWRKSSSIHQEYPLPGTLPSLEASIPARLSAYKLHALKGDTPDFCTPRSNFLRFHAFKFAPIAFALPQCQRLTPLLLAAILLCWLNPLSATGSAQQISPMGNTSRVPIVHNLENDKDPKDEINLQELLGKLSMPPVTCRHCKEKFYDYDKFTAHKRTHQGKGDYVCLLCSSKFTNASQLKRHLQNLHGSPSDNQLKNYPCPFCDRMFVSARQAKPHINYHLKLKAFSCMICHKAFKKKSTLNQHKLSHSDFKGYSCKICKKKFKQMSTLTGHYTVHTDAKPYSCKICKKTYKTRATLRVHEKTHFTVSPGFPCKFCSKIYKGRSGLYHHNKKYHPTAMQRDN